MNPSDAERLSRLEGQQEEIRVRLARLEEAAGLRTAPAAPPVTGARAPEPLPAPAHPPPSGRGFETRMGLTWINRVGAVTLILGVAFFFKYAVEAGWIGEWPRVLLGAAAGLAAVAAGERTWRSGQQVWAQGMSAAGIGIFYVSFYAAFGLYHLIPQALAFFLMAVVTAGAAALALRYGAMALAALGLAGGFLTPPALGAPDAQPWFVLGYMLLLDAGAIYVARAREWGALEMVALTGTVGLGLAVSNGKPEQSAGFTLFVIAYYALFATGNRRSIFIPAQMAAALALAALWPRETGIFFAGMVLLAAAGLAVADRLGFPLAPLAAFWLGYAYWALERGDLGTEVFWPLTAGFLALSAWAPWKVWKRGARATVQDLLLIALNAGLYFAVGYGLLMPDHRVWAGLFAVLLAALHMAFGILARRADARLPLLAMGVGWALLVLAAPAQFSGYRVTMVWSLEAAALAWTGARFDERRAVWGSLAVFFLAFMRLCAVDAGTPAAATLANARFLTFALTAVCLWGAARWMAHGKEALAAYVSGQFVALWGLSLEVSGWAGRAAIAANLRSAESVSLSILWAAWAVLLVTIGAVTRSAVNRILGLGLIAIVVAKLYLYDVWFLGLFYRMAAFAVLGALLLAMSYLYSRFRASIDTWWRDRRA